MKIVIVYDNTSTRPELTPDWGFSAFIEVKDKKILFDTGANGKILLENMKKLNINAKDITDVFISHYHFDHTGGLSAFLNENRNVKVWIPPTFRGLKNVDKTEIEKPTKLYEGIYSTGQLNNIEQSLLIETPKGIIIIVGCSHPDIKDILNVAREFGKPFALIGGLHSNKTDKLKGLQLICATHCTKYKEEIKQLYKNQYIEGGAGKIINL